MSLVSALDGWTASLGLGQNETTSLSLPASLSLSLSLSSSLRHGILQEVFARELVPGDVVCVSLGDRLPADMRIIEVGVVAHTSSMSHPIPPTAQGTDLQVNESSFTGETMPSAKNSQVVKGNPSGAVTDLTNIVYMGTFVVSGRGMGVVICGAEDSEFGTVFKMMETMEVGGEWVRSGWVVGEEWVGSG